MDALERSGCKPSAAEAAEFGRFIETQLPTCGATPLLTIASMWASYFKYVHRHDGEAAVPVIEAPAPAPAPPLSSAEIEREAMARERQRILDQMVMPDRSWDQ